MSNSANEITSVHPDGIKYYGNTSQDKFRMRFNSSTGRLYVDIERPNGAVVEYCIASCGEVSTTTSTTGGTTTGAPPTTTTSTPAPNRYCQPGDLGYNECFEVGQCRSGATGALCSGDLTTTTAAPTTTTAATTTAAPTTTSAPATTTAAPTTTSAPAIDCSSGYTCTVGGVCSPLPPGASANCRTYNCTKDGCAPYSYCAGASCP